jgi:hypothetical protein
VGSSYAAFYFRGGFVVASFHPRMAAKARRSLWPWMRWKRFSVSSQAEAAHRSTISAVRQRVTLRVRRSTPPCGLPMMLVVARHLDRLGPYEG